MDQERIFPEDDQRLYAQIMSEIRGRCLGAKELLHYELVDGHAELNLWHANYAALQLRLCIEMVVMASMVANRQELEKVGAKFEHSQPKAAHRLVRELNPLDWPQPFELLSVDHGDGASAPYVRGRLLEGGFMTESLWLDGWNYVSSLLHAQNPYKMAPAPLRPDLPEVYTSLLRSQRELWALLRFHRVVLLDPGTALLFASSTVKTGTSRYERRVASVGPVEDPTRCEAALRPGADRSS